MVDIRQVSFGLNTSDVVGLTEIQRTAIDFQMCVSVADLGTWKYRNERHPRWEYAYGYAQIMSGAFVVKDIPLSYINEEILYFHNSSFGIQETVACFSKEILKALGAGDTTYVTNLRRERITSVRFRFFPGVLANCLMIYEVGQSQCGGTVSQPDPSEGQPPNPLNHSHDPTSRPPDQGGDPRDNSPNDNEPPGPGQNQPPSTGITPLTGVWYQVFHGYNANESCAEFQGASPLAGCTDPDVSPTYIITGNAPCPGTYKGKILYKGNVVNDSLSDFDSMSFIFQPDPNQ